MKKEEFSTRESGGGGRVNPVWNKDDSPLCCCEYVNSMGERSHLLGLCCDCESLDQAVDNMVFGRGVEDQAVWDILAVVEDRMRLPWRGGAVRLPLSKVTPPLLLPCQLWLASLHPLLVPGVLLLVMPLSLYLAMRYLFKYRPKTKFFLFWSYTSSAYLFYLYEVKLVGLFWDLPKTVSFWENLVLISLILLSLAAYFLVRKGAQQERETGGRMCRVCGHLVAGKDHHCVWLDLCISYSNKPMFLVFLTLVSLASTHLALILSSSACPGTLIGPVLLPTVCWPYTPDSRLLLVGGLYSAAVALCLVLLLLGQLTRRLRGRGPRKDELL